MLACQKFARPIGWPLPAMLFRFELWNGWGHYLHGVNSAYVWSWTSEQEAGKYVGEGKWSSTAWDSQPGCAGNTSGAHRSRARELARFRAGRRGLGAGARKRTAREIRTVQLKAAHRVNTAASGDVIVLNIRNRGGDIRVLQEKLRKLSFPCGNVDGSYGDMTANGVVAFQRQHGLKGQPGAWYKSYDAVLDGAPATIPEERKDATPATLEARGDILSRALRLVRNVVAGFGLLLIAFALKRGVATVARGVHLQDGGVADDAAASVMA